MNKQDLHRYRMTDTFTSDSGRLIGIREKTGLVSDPKTLFKDSISKSENIDKSNNDMYNCFAISYLFDDLFNGSKSNAYFCHHPLINLNDVPIDHKNRLSFLLPPEIFSSLEQKDKVVIKENKKKRDSGNSKNKHYEDHFAHFFQLGYSDNIISDLLYDIYFEKGWKYYLESIQNHIINNLVNIKSLISEELILYLTKVGSDTIAPKKISEKANAALFNLIEQGKKGDKRAIALIVANFFISCFLGLRSMNFDSGDTGKNPSFKTYILSSTGMERIWRPDLISPPYERLFDSRRLFENANYEGAITTIEDWLKEYGQEASNEAKALAFQIIGTSLYILAMSGNKKHENREAEGIEYLKKCIETGKPALSVFYSLYDYLKKSNTEEATKYLETAFEQNYAKAVIEVATLFLNGTYVFDDVTEGTLLKKINYVIEHERRNDVDDVGKCLYLHGRFARNHGNESIANKNFVAASRRGNERARQEIARKKRNERNTFPSFINKGNAPCCYANTFSGNNYTVVSTFPSETWVMYTSDKMSKKDINWVSSIEEFIDIQAKSGFKHSRLVFLLMSEDEEKNLNECLILLDKLFNVVLDKREEEKWKIIDTIDIFVNAKYETASLLVDANISDMGSDIYFKVHIMDENRDTVHKLLCEAPLFLPALKKESKTEVVLFGSSEINYNFIKESIACAYLGASHEIRITLLGDNADALENRLHQECPGIYSNNPHISCIKPAFIKCTINDTDFPSYIYGKKCDQVLRGECEKPFDIEIVNTLLESNYFIIDYSNDLENISFAANLRTWLLRSKGNFKRVPFIGVKCSDEQNSYLASHLTLSGQASGNSYFNKYDLFPIGVSAQTYSYENLIINPVLNDFALRIHKSYYGDNDRAAENDFYSYSYNADSSLSTTVGLCYRFFAAGVIFYDKDNYLDFGFFKTPGIETKFEEVYKENLKGLAVLEQSRWNGFMLSRGWESANKSEVQTYKEQSTGWQHKHVLAKKHPFIREWEDLNASKLTELLDILKSKFDYDRHPQVTTKKSIEDTAKFFNIAEKTDEKSH